MKATLTFDMDEYDDKMAHLRCTKALEMALCIWDINRTIERFIDESEDGKHIDAYRLQDQIKDVCYNHNINLEELIN